MKIFIRIFFIIFLISFFSCLSSNKQLKTENEIKTARDALETARYYVKVEKYKKAIYFYNIVLDKYKDNNQEAAWALYEKAYCYYKLKKYKIALQTFNRVRVIYPDEYGPIKLADKMVKKIEAIR